MFEHDSEAVQPTLNDALKLVAASLDALARVDLESEDGRALLDAAVALQECRNRLDGQQLRVLDAVDRREAHRHDGALTTASWLRSRTRQTHAEATQQVNAAIRLRRFPLLRSALESGDITMRHVTEVTRPSVPRRIDVIAACEESLRDVAVHGSPAHVRRAVARITDANDHAGEVDALADEGPDERRDVTVFDGIDGLVELRATLDPLDAEAFRTALDAFETPDPPDTPAEQRRSAGQRRADAVAAMVAAALRAKGAAKTVDGYPAQISVVVDLLALLGLDTLADAAQVSDAQVAAIAALADVDEPTARRIAAAAVTRAISGDTPGLGQPARQPRARYSGPIDISVVRRLALHAKVQAVLTLGPYRPVAVGRLHRSLPPWLRTALAAVHGHCRGPDCDRPTPWCDSHHHDEWAKDGETDVNRMTPQCRAHHTMLTTGGWTVDLDCETGTATWTGPDAQTISTHPPPL